MADGEDDLLAPEAVARELGVDSETVRRWFDKGIFTETSRTPGGHRRVTRREVARVKADLAERSAAGVAAGGKHR